MIDWYQLSFPVLSAKDADSIFIGDTANDSAGFHMLNTAKRTI